MLRKVLVALIFLMVAQVGRAEPTTIVAFGDSLTQGFGLKQKAGFVPQLEKWLKKRGADVTVVNAGVSGDTTAGGAARIDWTLSDQPDAMVVAEGVGGAQAGGDRHHPGLSDP